MWLPSVARPSRVHRPRSARRVGDSFTVMDVRYHAFTTAHPRYYERAGAGTAPARFRLTPDLDWGSWQRRSTPEWEFVHRPGSVLPAQGWKIHVSATLATAVPLLRAVSGFCSVRGLPFKYVPDRATLLQRNSKHADRAVSGKFITIYPPQAELQELLRELDTLIGGTAGPYILSDLRWNEGPLYLRYGGFAPTRMLDADDEQVPAILGPRGILEADRRAAVFAPPGWLTIPDFIAAQRAALDAPEPSELDAFTVHRALQHSNGGGTYLATRTASGESVVIKEGRPHAGLDGDGHDAASRVRQEIELLGRLADVPGVVRLLSSFVEHGHVFAVLDEVPGEPLARELVARIPTIRAGSTRHDRDEYRGWALGLAQRLEATLHRVHRQGIVHGDLHPGNILVTPAGDPVLIDWELGHESHDPRRAVLGAPGYVSAAGHTGIAADRYALACIKLALFMPLTVLISLDPAKADDLIAEAHREFGLPEGYLQSIRDDLAPLAPGRPTTSPARSRVAEDTAAALERWNLDDDGLFELQLMLSRSIAGSADFSRADRAYPADIATFAGNGYSLAHGAAGVLSSLAATGFDLDPLAIRWLADAVEQDTVRAPGLYDGLAGAAWFHREIGHDAEADELLAELRALDYETLPTNLGSGLAGIGLLYLDEVSRSGHREALAPDPRHAAPALPGLDAHLARIFELIEHRFDARDPAARSAAGPVSGSTPGTPGTVGTGRGGLLRGVTGTALFALRLHKRTAHPAHLEFARRAVEREIGNTLLTRDGSRQLNENWRSLPYLASGSAGLGLVIAELLPLVDEAERAPLMEHLRQIELAAHARFVIQPALFAGRAGLIHFLAELVQRGLATERTEQALEHHTRALRLHAIRDGTGIAFPGEQLLRLSSDLATGTAGVLTALEAYARVRDERAAGEPLLPVILARSPHPGEGTTHP